MAFAPKKPARTAAVAAKTASLAQDTADMETKLMELRKAMEQERAKREKAGQVGFWSSAGAIRTKTSKTTKPESSLPFLQQQPSSGGGSDSKILQTLKSSNSTPAPGSIGSAVERKSGNGISAGYGNLQVSGAATSATPIQNSASSRPGSTRNASSKQANILQVHSSGTGDEQGLCTGTFDEADSHQSFLEALNEWRAANRAGQQQQQCEASTSSNQGTCSGAVDGGCASATGIQTEGKMSRPSSAAKPTTYFNKLMINNASRQAAQAVLPVPSHAAEPSTSSTSQPAADASQSSHQQHSLPPLTGPTMSESGTASRTSTTALPQRISQVLPVLTSPTGSRSQIYALETAMNSTGSTRASRVQQKGLDILEELERLEAQHRKQHTYDSDDEDWSNLMMKVTSPATAKAYGSQGELPVIVTAQPGVGLTKGVRLPDAILLPSENDE